MNTFRRLTLSITRGSGWKLAVIFGFSALLVLGLLLARAHTASAASGATITSDQADYQPGATVTLTGAGWDSGEAVHIFVNDSVGNTWSLSSNPDPVADSSGSFTYSFSLPTSFVSSYTVTATGATSGTATTTFTDSNCPSLSGKVASNVVFADKNTIGSTTTYTFSSANESPTNGVPGLVDYCVYPTGSSPLLPTLTDITPQAVGANGAAWGASVGTDNFSFNRPDGDPSNIPLDGSTITMGTTTWSGSVPTSQTILLHINDSAECQRLYGGTSSTCFVLPGTQQKTAQPLTVSKDATASFDLKYTWSITKDVDKTVVKQIGGSATFNYTVTVSHDSGTPGNWQVNGTITVTNPNGSDVTGVNVTDAVTNGGTCTVTNGTNVTVPANSSVQRSYTCTYSSAPSPSSGTNTATATWSTQTLSDGSLLQGGSASTPPVSFDFGSVNPNLVDECVSVSDPIDPNSPHNFCVGDSTLTFTYSRTVNVPQFDCVSYTNTATFTTNDTGATGSASQTVKACGPAKTGALTIGFWKTTNGQNLIKTYCNNGANNLGTYLAGLGSGSGPFSNAPTVCSTLATYVYNTLNGASATNMNNMLKAQMMGTALDVWFSGPGWTSTKIAGVKPPSNFLSNNSLGSFMMDTTAICPMVDNLSTGTATCQNNTPSTDAVAAGAVPSSPMSMQALLNFAATTPSPFNGLTGTGSNWYGSNRTLQEILKNIFDQFNNQMAFGSF